MIILLLLAIAILAAVANTGVKSSVDSTGRCPTCGGCIQIHGSRWECGWCGDCGIL